MHAFISPGKPADSFVCPQGTESIKTAGQNFVNIGLMADIEYNTVPGRVKHFVQRQGQFNNPQIGSQMTASTGNRLNHHIADFLSQARHLFEGKLGEFVRQAKGFQITFQKQGSFQV